MSSLYVVLSTLALLIVDVHCQRLRGDRTRGFDPIDTLGLGGSSFDLSQVHDLSQPLSNTETLLQRRERLAAELASLDQALGPSDTSIAGSGRRRNRQRFGNTGRRRNRQRNNDLFTDPGLVGSQIDRRNRQRDAGILIDPGHDHSHVESPIGRRNRQRDGGIVIDSGHNHLDPLDRLNRRRDRKGLADTGIGGRRSGHQNNFDAFLDRVLGPVGSGTGRIRGQGRRDRTINQHGHLDATHDHTTDILPGRRRDRQRHQETAANHAGHDHGSPGHQDGRFDAFLDNVLGPDPAIDNLNTKNQPKKKAQNKKGKGKKNAKKNTNKPVHTDHHDHTPKTEPDHHNHTPNIEPRREQQNRQQNGIRGLLQNVLLGELSRRLTGPRFGPQPFNPFVQRRPPMFILG